MPNTPRGLVYPDAGGHTRLWEHLQTLAETTDGALAALLGIGPWTNMTPASGSGTCRWRGITLAPDLAFVCVQLGLGSLSSTTGTVFNIVTAANGIPVGFRPTVVAQWAAVRTNVSGLVGMVQVTTDGAVQGLYVSGGGLAHGTINYLT